MDYATQVQGLTIDTEYILSPLVNVERVGGLFHIPGKYLQDRFHRLLAVNPGRVVGDWIVQFQLADPREHGAWLAPDRILLNVGFIPDDVVVDPLFLTREQVAARTIQRGLKTLIEKKKALHTIYSPPTDDGPAGPGYNKAKATWNKQVAGTRRRNRKSKSKSRKSKVPRNGK